MAVFIQEEAFGANRDRESIENIPILTLRNQTLAITNLEKSLCQSDVLINIKS